MPVGTGTTPTNDSQQTIIANFPTGTELNSDTSRLIPRQSFTSTPLSRVVGSDNGSVPVGIEQTIELDQMKRYLDHLNEIRRLNEGDDMADFPGYALHMVRIPVSVFPGRETQMGFGAEITLTVEPHLGDDLLPNTFRDFVINGVRDRIAPQVLAIADRANIKSLRAELNEIYGWIPTKTLPETPVNKDETLKDNQALQSEYPTEMENTFQREKTFLANVLKGTESQLLERLNANESGRIATISRNGRMSIPASQSLFVDGITLFRVGLAAFDALAISEEQLESRDKMPTGARGLHFQDIETDKVPGVVES